MSNGSEEASSSRSIDPICSESGPSASSSPSTAAITTSYTKLYEQDKLDRQRQRSQSLPSFDGSSSWFPSPSSAFRTPPINEAEILKDLISRERIKRDARLAKHKSSGSLMDTRRTVAASSSAGSGPFSSAGHLPSVPDGNESATTAAAPSQKSHRPKTPSDHAAVNRSPGSSTTPPHSPSQSDSTPTPTPTGSAISLHGFTQLSAGAPEPQPQNELPPSSTTTHQQPPQAPPLSRSASQNPPSRPSSSYQPYLPDLDQPKTEVARRLSLSATRRDSKMSIHSNQSNPFSAPSTPYEEKTELFVQEEVVYEEVPVAIRDFGFPAEDPRHLGLPAPVHSASSSSHSAQSTSSCSRVGVGGMMLPEGVFDDSSSESGVAPTPEGSSATFSWDFVPQHSDSPGGMLLSPTGDVAFTPPSQASDFADSEADSEDDRATERALDDAAAAAAAESASMDEIPEGGALYVAAYPFVPEAAQEMSLYVGEVVKVLERLCEGWVICVRQKPADDGSNGWVDAVETGLTPETYLQRYDLFSHQFDQLGLGDSSSSGGSADHGQSSSQTAPTQSESQQKEGIQAGQQQS